jgi:hypothetical protein
MLTFEAVDTAFFSATVDNGGSVPEPSTLAVLGLGILGLIGIRQHKAKPFPPVDHQTRPSRSLVDALRDGDPS